MAKKKVDHKNQDDPEERGSQEEIIDDELNDNPDLLERIKYNVSKQGWYSDLKICVCVLTRIPVYIGISPEDFSISKASRFFPIIGAVIGLFAFLVVWMGSWFDFSSNLLALFGLLTLTFITGALHEDGLADTFDGIGGGITRDQKLKIMRDSQIGTYGVMALLSSFGLRWAAYAEITDQGIGHILAALISAAAGSRAALPVIMYLIPVAREDGLSVSAGKPSFDRAVTALLIGVGFILFILGFRISIIAIGLSILAAGFFVYFVATRIGGQTGDVLGAAQQIIEITILLAIIMVGIE